MGDDHGNDGRVRRPLPGHRHRPLGRATLMLAGIALLGIVTASLASWLIDRVREVQDESQAATRRDVETLTREGAALRAMLHDRPGERGRVIGRASWPKEGH